MKGDRKCQNRRVNEVHLGFCTARKADSAVCRDQQISHVEAELIPAQPGVYMQVREIDPLLDVHRRIEYVHLRLCPWVAGNWRNDLAIFGMKEVDIDPAFSKVGSGHEQAGMASQGVCMQVLSAAAVLQTRVVLLNAVSIHRIVQVESEIGKQIE